MYDFLIVGAGLFGSTCAAELTKAGLRCLVVEKSEKVGGTAATEVRDEMVIHLHGTHVFHTRSARIWEYMQQWAEWLPYVHKQATNVDGRLVSIPINLKTFEDLLGTEFSEDSAKLFVQKETEKYRSEKNDSIEGWCLRNIGPTLFEAIIKGHTESFWGRRCAELPAAIVKRLPVRFMRDDSYFGIDTYQGVPSGGYTPMMIRMLQYSDLVFGVDYLKDKKVLRGLAENVIYTGRLDEYFGFKHGRLDYRGTEASHVRHLSEQLFPVATVTYQNGTYVRSTEHRHFEKPKLRSEFSWVTYELPSSLSATHPVRTQESMKIQSNYEERFSDSPGMYFGGRLASYLYMDMDQTVASALAMVRSLLTKRRS